MSPTPTSPLRGEGGQHRALLTLIQGTYRMCEPTLRSQDECTDGLIVGSLRMRGRSPRASGNLNWRSIPGPLPTFCRNREFS